MSGDKREDKDSFWDISKLVPPRRGGMSRFSQGPALSPVTVEAPREETAEATADRRLSPPPIAPDVKEHTYTPEGNPLLLSVTVRRTVGGYSFYEQFRRDADRLFDAVGAETPYTPFFSFSPQYNQLNEQQRAYYLYFRTEVRAGRYPRADKGYLFLLVYEIINLPERVPPVEGALLLAALWNAYRADIAGIDRFFIPWLTDYCLVYGLPCPPLSSSCLSAAAEGDGVEFFFGNAAEGTEEGVLRLLALSSDYHFEGSRAVTEENRALFTRHIVGAMTAVLPHLLRAGLIGRGERPECVKRRAFLGSLCAHNVRAELEFTYISLRRSEGLRKTVGLAVKYAENHLRAALGIRARLSAAALVPEWRAVIDRYFAGVASAIAPKRAAPPPPAYERLYDAPEEGLDRASAAAIEHASWELTRRLVPEEELTEEAPPPVTFEMPVPLCETVTEEGGALPSLVEAFLRGGDAPARAARAAGLPIATAAEEINEVFLSLLGDVLIEACGEEFTLIEDYREEAEKWLKNNRK